MIESDKSVTFNLFVLHHQDLIFCFSKHCCLLLLSIRSKVDVTNYEVYLFPFLITRLVYLGRQIAFCYKRPYLSESDLLRPIIRQTILTMKLFLIFCSNLRRTGQTGQAPRLLIICTNYIFLRKSGIII